MYYHKHPEKNMRVVLLKDQKEDIEWLLANQTKRSENASDTESFHSIESGSKNMPGQQTKTSSSALSKCRKKDGSGNGCGGCGKPVGPVHKCDICSRNMHPFCGRTIGEEGYGSAVRCPACDRKPAPRTT
jgi:hypothetical protein